MYIVRAKTGRIMGRYATKAEAEARKAQLKRQLGGVRARSPGQHEGWWIRLQPGNNVLAGAGLAHNEQKAKSVATAHARQGYTVELWNNDFLVDTYPPSRKKGSRSPAGGHRSVIQSKAKRAYGGQWESKASGQRVFIHYVDPGNNHVYFQLVPFGGRGNMSLEEFKRLYRKLPAGSYSPVSEA